MSSFVARWLKISLVVIVGCGFLAMMIYALVNRDEIQSSQIEPPLITPPAEALKRRPDQPGGMQIPNRDKLVFDLLDGSNTALGETGVGMGTAEVSTTASVSVSEVAVAPAVVVSDSISRIVEAEAVAPVKVAVPVSPLAVVAKPVEKAAEKVAEKKPDPVKPVVKVEEKKIEPKVAEEKPAAKVAGGKWGVQLAAVNSVADGNAMASKAAKDFAALKVLTPKISAVPGGKKFRVQFVGLKDRAAAADVCAKLKGKQGCFPVSVQ